MSSLLRLCRTAILLGGTEGILLLPTEVGLRSVATLGVLRLADSVDTFHRLMQTLHALPAPLRLRVE